MPRFQDKTGELQIFSLNLGSIFAGSDKAQKFYLQNDMSRSSGTITGRLSQYSDSDLINMFTWGICPNTLSCPFGVSASVQAGGSLSPDTTYYYRITGFNALGETTGSLEVSATTTSVNKQIRLSWFALPGTSGYIIYRSTNQIYTSARRMIIEDPAILSWTDDGISYDPSSAYGWPGINTDFDLPADNTTAGQAPDYGTPPLLSAANLAIDVLSPGQQVAIWGKVTTSAATPEENNPRSVIMDFPEA